MHLRRQIGVRFSLLIAIYRNRKDRRATGELSWQHLRRSTSSALTTKQKLNTCRVWNELAAESASIFLDISEFAYKTVKDKRVLVYDPKNQLSSLKRFGLRRTDGQRDNSHIALTALRIFVVRWKRVRYRLSCRQPSRPHHLEGNVVATSCVSHLPQLMGSSIAVYRLSHFLSPVIL